MIIPLIVESWLAPVWWPQMDFPLMTSLHIHSGYWLSSTYSEDCLVPTRLSLRVSSIFHASKLHSREINVSNINNWILHYSRLNGLEHYLLCVLYGRWRWKDRDLFRTWEIGVWEKGIFETVEEDSAWTSPEKISLSLTDLDLRSFEEWEWERGGVWKCGFRKKKSDL
jgi:hypothetical protein